MKSLGKFLFWAFPVFGALRGYRREWWRADWVAGVAVAAVQVPTAVAYAQMIGFPAEVGLYACVAPMLLYALVGGSRQLIVGPDAATCTMLTVVLVPLSEGSVERMLGLSVVMTLLVGGISVVLGAARFGFVANFLSRPILVGYFNGIGISMIAGQVGRMSGVVPNWRGIFKGIFSVSEVRVEVPVAHGETLLVGLLALGGLVALRFWKRQFPAALAVAVVGGLAAWGFGLGDRGVALMGEVRGGLPALRWPEGMNFRMLMELLPGALGITVISYCGGMLTASGFASRRGYSLDPNREFVAMGVANIGAAFSQGFAICGAGSRTEANDFAGGKTQLTGVVGALVILVVLLFFAGALQWVPQAILGAVLVVGGWGLIEVRSLGGVWRMSRFEFGLSVLTAVGVLTIGALPGVVLAVGLTLLRVLQLAYRPGTSVLGWVEGVDGQVDVRRFPGARTLEGLMIYRFEAPLLFFNAGFFKEEVLKLVEEGKGNVREVLFVAEAVAQVDVTGMEVLEEVRRDLEERGVKLTLARVQGAVMEKLERAGLVERIGRERIFTSVRSGVDRFLEK